MGRLWVTTPDGKRKRTAEGNRHESWIVPFKFNSLF